MKNGGPGCLPRRWGLWYSGVARVAFLGLSGVVFRVWGMKWCAGCGRWLSRGCFYTRVSENDGLRTPCKECAKARAAAYYAANAERVKARVVAWTAANVSPERRRGYEAAWRARNPEAARELGRVKSKRCQERKTPAFRARRRAKRAAQRARQRAAFVERVDPRVVLERSRGLCGVCGASVDPDDFHVDHVVPLARGGEHSYANTQAAHPACNLAKGAQLMCELSGS